MRNRARQAIGVRFSRENGFGGRAAVRIGRKISLCGGRGGGVQEGTVDTSKGKKNYKAEDTKAGEAATSSGLGRCVQADQVVLACTLATVDCGRFPTRQVLSKRVS